MLEGAALITVDDGLTDRTVVIALGRMVGVSAVEDKVVVAARDAVTVGACVVVIFIAPVDASTLTVVDTGTLTELKD